MKIYLAGRISKNDWRHVLVPALKDADANGDWREQIVPFASGGHRCVGPFFVGCDHGCSHLLGEHGVTREQCQRDYGGHDWYNGGNDRERRAPDVDITTGGSVFGARRTVIVNKCRGAIESSDSVFCWLEDLNAFGSLWEMGYAAALRIPVMLGIADGLDASELWFSVHGVSACVRSSDPIKAFASLYPPPRSKSESPIEETMRKALASTLPSWANVAQQVEVLGGKYRLDFEVVGMDARVAVECDGHDFHERTKEQARRDRRRDRDLTRAGYKVMRFTGSEIYADAARCAREVASLVFRRNQ